MRRLTTRDLAGCSGPYQDSARFTWQDAGELVLAAVACPVCLTADPVRWTYGRWGRQAYLDCACPDCRVRWYLRVTPEQLFRISSLDIIGRLP
jgi:hypothetical protein